MSIKSYEERVLSYLDRFENGLAETLRGSMTLEELCGSTPEVTSPSLGFSYVRVVLYKTDSVLVELVRPSRLFCTDLRVTLDGWCEGRRSLHQGSDILALIYK